MSDVIFTGLLQLGDVKNKFIEIKNENKNEENEIRKNLYNKTIKRYNTLKYKHIKSVNFILPNNKMFLKIKQPNKYNYSISKERHLISYVHKNQQPINSYETGNNGAGFRFVYPVLNNDEYLGIVSITFGAEAITSAIMNQYYVLSNFFINENNFNKKLLESKPKLFKKSHHNGYIYDMRVLKELKRVSRLNLKQRRPSKNIVNKMHKSFDISESKSLYFSSIKMVYTSIPIKHTITKNKDAILIIKSNNEALNILYKNELIQCLINIFNNAKDILVEKNIENKFVFISISLQEDKAIIKIKDNGGGIPENIINKIFEPYFTTKHQSQGTGLGLHMIYNLIVDGMSGSIEANNIEYKYNDKKYIGAEFTIILPID